MKTGIATIEFLGGNCQKVEATVRVDKYGDLYLDDITINGTFYRGKQIRTVKREEILLDYIEKWSSGFEDVFAAQYEY